MANLLWVMLGGAVGAGARYLVAGAWLKESSVRFPYGTLTANLVGCFLIGILATTLTTASGARPEVRLALIVGVLGGFTTFSSYGFETLELLRGGRLGSAVTYVLVSTVVGIALAYAGARIGSALTA